MDKAQKGISGPGYRPVQRRHDDQNPGADDALGNLVRFVLMPGHRFDTVGVAPLIDGLAFEGFIADKAFDSNSIIADLNERGAKSLSHSIHDALRLCRSTRKSTSGVT